MSRYTLGFPTRTDAPSSLLQSNRLVFKANPPEVRWFQSAYAQSRLEHLILDGDGNELGRATETYKSRGRRVAFDGRPRFSQVHLDVFDRDGRLLLELTRRAGVFGRPVSVRHEGAIVGQLVEHRRRCTLEGPGGALLGTIHRKSRGYAVDYVVEDAVGRPVGRISDHRYIASDGYTHAANPGPWWRKRPEPEEHVLFFDEKVDPELRMLTVAAGAAVYLVLQKPYVEGGD